MITMSARLFALVIVLLVAKTGSAQPAIKTRVSVDLRAHPSEIRAALLRFTPLGSDVTKVQEFVSQELQRPGDEPVTVENQAATLGSGERGVKRISVDLGQYYFHPEIILLSAPVLMQREVTAQWVFDQHDRLIDIAVEKKSRLY
jgi:hypothetical protein